MARARAEVVGEVVEAPLDLLVQVGDQIIVERKHAAEERVEDHSTRPDVHFGTFVRAPIDEL